MRLMSKYSPQCPVKDKDASFPKSCNPQVQKYRLAPTDCLSHGAVTEETTHEPSVRNGPCIALWPRHSRHRWDQQKHPQPIGHNLHFSDWEDSSVS